MGTPKSVTNDITRALLDSAMETIAVGNEFHSGDIVKMLSQSTRRRKRRCVSPRVVGNLLSERNDVQINRNTGMWKKVRDTNTQEMNI